jgi:hypothetical protein
MIVGRDVSQQVSGAHSRVARKCNTASAKQVEFPLSFMADGIPVLKYGVAAVVHSECPGPGERTRPSGWSDAALTVRAMQIS